MTMNRLVIAAAVTTALVVASCGEDSPTSPAQAIAGSAGSTINGHANGASRRRNGICGRPANRTR